MKPHLPLMQVLVSCSKKYFMRKSVLLVISTLFLSGIITAQKLVDYSHKSIQKTLEKTYGIPFNAVKVMSMDAAPQSGQYFQVLNNGESFYMYVGRVNSCRSGGCSVSNAANTNGVSEYFDYFMVLNHQGEVQQVKIFNYAATHGYEVTAKGWLKQFIGYSGNNDLEVGKEIDSISGATISVHALTNDVNEKTKQLKAQIEIPQTAIIGSY